MAAVARQPNSPHRVNPYQSHIPHENIGSSTSLPRYQRATVPTERQARRPSPPGPSKNVRQENTEVSGPPSPPRSRRDPSETPSGLGLAFGGYRGGKWWDEELPPPPASLSAILESFRQSGEGDRELLLSILGAKKAEEERLTALIQTRLTVLQARLSLHSAAANMANQSPPTPISETDERSSQLNDKATGQRSHVGVNGLGSPPLYEQDCMPPPPPPATNASARPGDRYTTERKLPYLANDDVQARLQASEKDAMKRMEGEGRFSRRPWIHELAPLHLDPSLSNGNGTEKDVRSNKRSRADGTEEEQRSRKRSGSGSDTGSEGSASRAPGLEMLLDASIRREREGR